MPVIAEGNSVGVSGTRFTESCGTHCRHHMYTAVRPFEQARWCIYRRGNARIKWRWARQRASLQAHTDVTAWGMRSLESLYACSPGAASVRGPGQLVGEVSLFETGSTGAAWLTSVLASEPTTALRLTAPHLRALLQRRPEAEAAVHAGTCPSPGNVLAETANQHAGHSYRQSFDTFLTRQTVRPGYTAVYRN